MTGSEAAASAPDEEEAVRRCEAGGGIWVASMAEAAQTGKQTVRGRSEQGWCRGQVVRKIIS
jgi:hypothetical protein